MSKASTAPYKLPYSLKISDQQAYKVAYQVGHNVGGNGHGNGARADLAAALGGVVQQQVVAVLRALQVLQLPPRPAGPKIIQRLEMGYL